MLSTSTVSLVGSRRGMFVLWIIVSGSCRSKYPLSRVPGRRSPFFPDTVVSLCALNTFTYLPLCSLQCSAKLCNHDHLIRPIYRALAICAWRARGHASRRDHMTDASQRGNQLVFCQFLACSKVLVTVRFLIRLSSSTTLLRVRAIQYVE